MPANLYGQTTPTQSAPAAPGDLGGSTYEGAFSNSVASLPLLGGAANSLLTSLYGSKPATADPVDTAQTAIMGNLANLGDISQLTLGTDTTAAQGAQLPYLQNLPNYTGMLQSETGNVGQELQGQLPTDVQNQIQEAGAQRGIATGQGAGSPNTGASELADLGLTSLNMNQLGQQGFGQLMQQTPTGQSFNPANEFVTPAEEQEAQQYANTIAAAPDPEAAGLMNTALSMVSLF
jgi:hypothetical protein